jgi:hypothetical protein
MNTPTFNVILTGTEGMNKALAKKIQKAPFGASHKSVERPMHGWEVTLVRYDGSDNFSWKQFEEFIGRQLIRNYSIKFTHC